MLQFSKTKMKSHISKHIPFIPKIITTILMSLKAVKYTTCETLGFLGQEIAHPVRSIPYLPCAKPELKPQHQMETPKHSWKAPWVVAKC